jgi:hypothetical protein
MTFRSTFSSSSYNGYQSLGGYWILEEEFSDNSRDVSISPNGNYIACTDGNVYYYDGNSWSTQTLGISPAGIGDFRSISINDNADTIAIGKNFNPTYNVEIYTRSGTSWSLQSTLTGTGGSGNNEGFGWSVSLDGSGDYLIVGAPDEDTSPNTNNGAAYFFTRAGSTWTQQSKFLSASPQTNGFFGRSVSISNDSNYVCVGAPGEDLSPFTNNGIVYTYTRSGTTLIAQNSLTPSNALGSQLAGVGWGVNLDSNGDLIFTNQTWNTVGGIWNYTRTGNSWSETEYLELKALSNNPPSNNSLSGNDDNSLLGLGIGSSGSKFLIILNQPGYKVFQSFDKPASGIYGSGVSVSKNSNYMCVTSPDSAGSSSIYLYNKLT